MRAGPKRTKHIKLGKYLKPETPVHEIATAEKGLVFCGTDARAADVLSIMLNRGTRRVPVIDSDTGRPVGMISTTDMLDFLGAGDRHALFSKRKVGLDVRADKIMKTGIRTIDLNQDVSTAIGVMRSHNVGGLPLTKKGKLAGFVSERDIIKRIKGRVGIRTRDVMRKKPFFVKERFPVFDVARIMVHGPYRRLPVVKDGILVGIVTPYDILKYLNKRRGLRDLRSDRSPIMRAMNPNVLYAKAGNRLHDAIDIMLKRHVGGLPVVEGDEMDIVGIITERDIIDLLE